MRPLIPILLAASLAGTGAFAQTPAQTNKAGADQSSSASETLNPSLATGAPPIPAQSPSDLRNPAAATTGDRANASASLPVVPSDWSGDAKSWAAHTKACKAKYRGYDAGTDQYPAKGAGMTKCMLAMPKAK